MTRTDLLRRVQEYAHRNNLVVGEQLGHGLHGIVCAAKNQTKGGQTALKVHEREQDYRQERDVYLRLQEHAVNQIRGCHVPQMVALGDDLWVIAMTVVERPFVLDLAGAFLDQAPDFSEVVLADWREEKLGQFGARWPQVQAILGFLEGYGTILMDVNPGNVSFSNRFPWVGTLWGSFAYDRAFAASFFPVPRLKEDMS